MIDNIIRAATCRTSCGSELGTGHLVGQGKLLTARHCVLPAIEAAAPIELTFTTPTGDVMIVAAIAAESAELDVAVLSFDHPLDCAPIPLSSSLPREGGDWRSFGYPKSKTSIGHRISGTVSHILPEPKGRMDIDLAIDPTATLHDYHGLSGSSVVCDGVSVAVLRRKVDGTVGGISNHRIAPFLGEAGIDVRSGLAPSASKRDRSLASREPFQRDFEKLILAKPGEYFFLEGAHGIGKTTFCQSFRPLEAKLHSLGAYSLFLPNIPQAAVFRAQPEILFDWLATAVSTLITKQPPRKEERSYATMIAETSTLLNAWSDYCSSTKRIGVLLLDGLNEAQDGDSAQLQRLIGLLPLVLPSHITVVLTAPNFSNIAVHLVGRVKTQNVFRLPPLTDAASLAYCHRELIEERSTPTRVRQICDKALGHPLYLRYLIEYANASPADDALEEFPTLTGPIEQYYEIIWGRLLIDPNAIQLIAIMARLRGSLEFKNVVKALNAAEQSVMVPTIAKIKHLLTTPDRSGIYHPSFAAFAATQTKELDPVLHARLAEFCRKETAIDYCAANVVFHLLRGGETSRSTASTACNQAWVDKCVLLGTDPDVLLGDVNEVLAASIHHGPPTEVVRMLLLAQRVTFRYDSLFAQSARLMAEALIAVQRPADALKHVVRYKTLIVHPDDALQVAFTLIQQHDDEEALSLLRLLLDRILEAHTDKKMELGEFINLCTFHIRTLFMARLAGGQGGMKQVVRVVDLVKQVCKASLSDEPELAKDCVEHVACLSTSYYLAFRDTYPSLAQFKEKQGHDVPIDYFPLLCRTLVDFAQTVENHTLPKDRQSLSQVFADIGELRRRGGVLRDQAAPTFVDTLISFGAPSEVVLAFSEITSKAPISPAALKAKNGVDVDFRALHECARNWRINSFIKDDIPRPVIRLFDQASWLAAIEGLVHALFWCEGRSRRAKVDANKELHESCRGFLRDSILPAFSFTLSDRVTWKKSYAIPENVFPFLYRSLAEIILDCFPEDVSNFLETLSTRSSGQFGIYSEGYRDAIGAIVGEVMRRSVESSNSKTVLALLQQWREHVILGVENRHELVPELLKLIPLFSRMGANEEAERLYGRVLAVSMGPSWYKEEQLGLMTDTLANLSSTDDLAGRAQMIAAYLERASGEMTFQRYVRANKATLVGQLARRGLVAKSCAYFRRQSCGSLNELLTELEYGFVDKPSPRSGPRFPGGALEEQATILQLARNAKSADWRIRWALLEVFHCGDERHLEEFASEYAKIVNEAGKNAEIIPALVQRAKFVFGAETSPDLRGKFASAFRVELESIHYDSFAQIVGGSAKSSSKEGTSSQLAGESPAVSLFQPKPRRDDDDMMFSPGTFGRQAALRRSDEIVVEAEQQLQLGNMNAAKEKAVEALRAAQEGEWGIWGNLSEGTKRAKDILQMGNTDAANVIRFYSELLLAERHAPKWILADYLISRIAGLLQAPEQGLLLDHVTSHVHLMVGDAAEEAKMFTFLAAPTAQDDPTKELFHFLVWLTDHPKWLRRNRAAAALTWIVRDIPGLVEAAATRAFEMTDGYSADVLCGILDGLSIEDPLTLWVKIAPILRVDVIVRDCKHMSCLAILHAIASRAGKKGNTSGSEVALRIGAIFERPGAENEATEDEAELPQWGQCIQREWSALHAVVPNMPKVLATFERELKSILAPLTIRDAHSLEDSVCDSFRENRESPCNRWEAKLRFALNLAVHENVTKDTFFRAASILRITNPLLPELTLISDFESPGPAAIRGIVSGNFAPVIGTADTVFLNYVEILEAPMSERLCRVEVVAVVVPSALRRRGFFLPRIDAGFGATEMPDPSKANIHETCCSLRLETSALFGWMTPGSPLPKFMENLGAPAEAFATSNWRSGRRNQIRRLGQPVHEGCLLSVKRSAVKLPPSQKLAWIVRFNGELVTMVDEQNIQLL